MGNNKSNIKDLVESGMYFSEVKDWFCDKYVFCVYERVWVIILAIVMSALFCLSAVNLYKMFPLTVAYPFVKYVDFNADEVLRIKEMSGDKVKSPQYIVAEYLIKHYVDDYESFDRKFIDYKLKRIENSSSRKVYNIFKYLVSPNNIDGPLARYRANDKRIAKVKLIELLPVDGELPDRAIVTFDYIELFENGVHKRHDDQSVVMNFNLSDIQAVLNGLIPFEFSVTSYISSSGT